jgi:hypothetical protein
LNWDEPVRWHSGRPACALVAGVDAVGINRIIGLS